MIIEGHISAAHGRTIITIKDEKKQIEKMAKDNKMSVTAFIKIECYQMIYQKAI